MKALLFAAVLLVPATARAQSCPNVDPESGYPVVATADGVSADPAWLASVAHAAAYRWKVPSRRRDLNRGWERVERRLHPPEPRWADDWTPGDSHRAVVRLTLRRGAGKPAVTVVQGSGDKNFDETLTSFVDEPMPAAPPLPGLPAGVADDSIDVTLTFGTVPEVERRGMIRFAAAQTRIVLERGSLTVMPPADHRGRVPAMTVKYDVNVEGRVEARSIEFVRSGSGAFESAIRDGLMRARFTPPTSNCRPVAQTVVQTFGS